MKILFESIDGLISELLKLMFLLLIISQPFVLVLYLVHNYGETGKIVIVGTCFVIAFICLIWCIKIIRDPSLSRREKWDKLLGK